MASTIIQMYLKHVLELFFSADIGVRSVALDVITTVLHQGLIHPAQVFPSDSSTANLVFLYHCYLNTVKQWLRLNWFCSTDFVFGMCFYLEAFIC